MNEFRLEFFGGREKKEGKNNMRKTLNSNN